MNKVDIINKLLTSHQQFIYYLNSLTELEFMQAINEKWTTGQQLMHINLSLTPILKLTGNIEMIKRMHFGNAENPSRSYKKMLEDYKFQMNKGVKTTAAFEPPLIDFDERSFWIAQLMTGIIELSKNIVLLEENELDKYLLPHPVLGKLTLREMLYFTDFHCLHHHQQAIRNLKLNSI